MLSLLLKTRDQLAMIQNQNHFFQLSCVLHLNKIYTDFKQKKKNCVCLGVWLRLLFKVFFVLKCIKMMFFIFKKLFLRLTHQNDPKYTKKINF
jgi:hypothetical protein